jgi:hypothetical protein
MENPLVIIVRMFHQSVDSTDAGMYQGCQMVYFQTKNPNLDIFWRAAECKMLVYFMTIWNILRPCGIIYGRLVYFSRFGMFGPRKIWQPC